jgi:Family of unknown function (DUF5682)
VWWGRISRSDDENSGFSAASAGYSDGERWWEQMVEQRQDSTDLFEAILEAMTALRQALEAEEGGRSLA